MNNPIVFPESTQTAKVLVVEDDEKSRILLSDSLRARGYIVFEAVDGSSALKAVEAQSPDVILLDLMMPGIDGFEVCQQLKRNPYTAPIPVLVVTSLADRASRLKAIECGANDYLTKPLDVQEMFMRVRNAVESRHLITQVQHAAERIQELEAVRDELTHMIVRDMKAPLTGLSGLLEIIRSTAGARLKGEPVACLRDAIDATDTLMELVDALIDVRRTTAGAVPLERHPCDLLELSKETAETLHEAADLASVSFIVTGIRAQVSCDGSLMRRVMRYLLKTALRRSVTGQAVRVDIQPQEGRVRVTVKDSGPQISEEQGRRLFELQDSSGVIDNGHLGLTFCRLVVESHGGQIGLDTPVSPGTTTVRFWLPVGQGEPEAGICQASPPDEDAKAGISGREAISAARGAEQAKRTLSLAKRGTGAHFVVVLAVTSVIPLLALVYLLVDSWQSGSLNTTAVLLAVPAALLLVGLGTYLLSRHATDVSRLRRYLEMLARGGIPERIALADAGDDMAAIEKCLGVVVHQTDERIRIIEDQFKALLRAEQQRVMIESLGAACHHIGQPATVIKAYLEMMNKEEVSPAFRRMIGECLDAADAVADILHRFNRLAAYQTEPYLPRQDSGPRRMDDRILKI